MPDKGGLQLLPETRKKIEVKVPGENRLLVFGAGLLILVIIAGVGLLFYNSRLARDLAAVDAQIVETEKLRDKEAEQKLILFHKQLSLIAPVLDNHVHWSKGLDILGSALQGQVQFKSLSASFTEKKIIFKARTKSYATIAKQIASFVSRDSISDATLDNVTTLTDGTLEFNMTLRINPDKFLEK